MKSEMSSVFGEQALAEKLSKLNSSQQSIQTLSHWCIFHRKKAKTIVETWDKQFNGSSKEQKSCFMYLANDILQNSKRKGGEFVNEFWKVLPAALRNVLENGDDSNKKVVTRLIEIWDDRKVFGSRSRALKDDIFGDSPPPPLVFENNAKASNSNSNSNSNPVKVVRKDATSVRIKLAVGGMPEKIMESYQSLFEENSRENSALDNSKSTINLMDKIERDINNALTSGDKSQVSSLQSEYQEKENSLRQSIEQLEGVESVRASLINQLKEAIQEQESKSELIRAKIQVARSNIDKTAQLKRKISPSTNGNGSNTSDFKMTAAEMAAKLAASSSSAQLFSSVLSSFALQSHNTTPMPTPNTGTSIVPDNKRPRLEPPSTTFLPFPPPPSMVPPPVHSSVPTSVPVQVPQYGAFPFNGSSMPPPSTAMITLPGQQGGNNGFFQSQPGIGFFPLQPAPSAQRQQ